MLIVKEDESFARDPKTNAILNVDNRALNAYKKRKASSNKVNELEQEIDVIKEDINTMKDNIHEIKNLLLEAVSRNKV